MLERFLAPVLVRYPALMARLLGEWPLVSVADCYQRPTDGAQEPPSELSQGIPTHVYQTWVHPKLGPTHASAISKFKHLNSSYTFWFYNSKEMDEYMRLYYDHHPIYEIYQKALFGPVKTDIWRYCILCERGGFYFDINKMVDVPLQSIVHSTDQALISYENNQLPDSILRGPERLLRPGKLILNWGLGFVKNHPILLAVLRNIVTDYPLFKGVRFDHVKSAVLDFTGPHQLTKTIHQLVREGEVSMHEAGVDFEGYGNPNIKGSWVRYASLPSYSRHQGGVIVQ